MKRIKSLNRYQTGILIIMIAMAVVFAPLYIMTLSRVGFQYNDTIFVPSQENGNTVYSAKLQGKPAQFTASANQSIVFQYGEKTYGPYTMKEDSTAIPKDEKDAEYMTGVELRRGNEILFRGGIMEIAHSFWLYNEDGTSNGFGISISFSDGSTTMLDGQGNVIDPAEPSVHTILQLMRGPELTHKGQWYGWFAAVLVCGLNAISILFADELFLWSLSFRVRYPGGAEASDMEITRRYISWTVLTVAALSIFIAGLQ